MLKKISLIAIVLVALFSVAGFTMAQEEESMVSEAPAVVNVGNKVCPVTGLKIGNPGEYTVEKDGKVYNLCCPDCKEKFLAEPSKYTAIVDAELAQTAPAVE